MEITTLQIVLVFIVACIAGMGSILDEFQFHRPLIACTLVGIVLGDMKTGIIITGADYASGAAVADFMDGHADQTAIYRHGFLLLRTRPDYVVRGHILAVQSNNRTA